MTAQKDNHPDIKQKISEVGKEIEKAKKWCKENQVAITIYANGTWKQLGGQKELYDFAEEDKVDSKRGLLEKNRMLRELLKSCSEEQTANVEKLKEEIDWIMNKNFNSSKGKGIALFFFWDDWNIFRNKVNEIFSQNQEPKKAEEQGK